MPTRWFTPVCLLAFILTVAACTSAGDPVEDAMNEVSPTVAWDEVSLADFDACFATGLLHLGQAQGPGRAHVPAPDDSIAHQVEALYPFQLHVDYQSFQWNDSPAGAEPTAVLPFSCHSNDPAFSTDSSYVEFSSGELTVTETADGNLQQIDVIISDGALTPSASAEPSPSSPQSSSPDPSASAPSESAEPSSSSDAEAVSGSVDPANFRTTDVNGLGLEKYAFTTPSGLHSCVISPMSEGSAPASATCVMAFSPGVVEESLFGLVIPYVDSDAAKTIVISDTAYMALDTSQVLEYGESLSALGLTCSVETTGIVCSSGAHSFSASASHLEFN